MVVLAGLVVLSCGADARAQPSCAAFSASAYGIHRTSPQPAAWVGDLYIAVGGGAVTKATFIDVNDEVDVDKFLRGLPFTGRETFTITFADGSTFDVAASFVGVPGSTPFRYELNETGQIQNGTGSLQGASGNVNVHGPFLSPRYLALPPWIGEMHGNLCGVTIP